MTLHVQYTFPKTTSAQSIRAKLLNAVKWINDEQLKLINQYLWTWQHRGDIQVTNKYGYKGGDAFAAIYIDDSVGKRPGAFWFVENGTSVRHAIMTKDFVAKTSPRRIQSGHGRGGVARVSKNYKGRGIEGRHVLVEISKILLPSMTKKVMDAISDISIGGPA